MSAEGREIAPPCARFTPRSGRSMICVCGATIAAHVVTGLRFVGTSSKVGDAPHRALVIVDATDRDAVPPPPPSMRSLYSDVSRALADLRAARGTLVSYALSRGDTANACATVEEARARSMRAIDRLAPFVESKARAGKLYELRGALSCYDVTPTSLETWETACAMWSRGEDVDNG